MIQLYAPSGFFVNGEWWAPDEWNIAVASADQRNKTGRVARDYVLAQRQVWAEEHKLAMAQRRPPKLDEDAGILAYSRWLERRYERYMELA